MEVLGERVVGSTRIVAVRADITRLHVDVIVNAANEYLAHGGGVAAAIARAGAPEVDAESRAWVLEHGPVGPGRAATTSAGPMPARFVVHVVGPRYREGHDNARLLTAATTAALNASTAVNASTVALPAISAGIFGYPPDDATRLIASAVGACVEGHPTLDEVLLVGYDAAMAGRFAASLERLPAD